MLPRIALTLVLGALLAACSGERSEPAAPQPVPAPEATATAALAPEPEPGKMVEPNHLELCSACHGREGPSPFADMATIQGLPAEAIENALYDFRAGTRPCRKSRCSATGECPDADMCTVAQDLDDADIAALAAWYAALPFVAAEQPYDPERAALGRQIHLMQCESCHAEEGRVAVDQSNRLRGQHKDYLRLALDAYRSGERLATGMMDISVKGLGDEEIAALLDFYASPE
jgi:sulfide dehydrogenase cytochrome subunit